MLIKEITPERLAEMKQDEEKVTRSNNVHLVHGVLMVLLPGMGLLAMSSLYFSSNHLSIIAESFCPGQKVELFYAPSKDDRIHSEKQLLRCVPQDGKK